MEQQHTSSFDKDFVTNWLKRHITELESQSKQKEAVNNFCMSPLYFSMSPDVWNNFRAESPSEESAERNLATRAAKMNKETKNVIAVGDSVLSNKIKGRIFIKELFSENQELSRSYYWENKQGNRRSVKQIYW